MWIAPAKDRGHFHVIPGGTSGPCCTQDDKLRAPQFTLSERSEPKGSDDKLRAPQFTLSERSESKGSG